ncbi:MAG TPA: hypothetical protein VD930_11910, partial [Gemmatimonadales bacterium]|nr:hypothetical protein [Gemmatimonadales bacterium]
KDIAEQAEQNNPGLALAGTYRDGVALGDAIGSGERAAARIGKFLGVEPIASGIPAAGLH